MRTKKTIEEIIEPVPIGNRQSALDAAPGIHKLWLYKKNCGYGPEDFLRRSGIQAWFKCQREKSHVFLAGIGVVCQSLELGAVGCPFCAGKRVCATNSLATNYPEVAKEYNSKKNGKTPDQVIAHSSEMSWFTCRKCRYEWQTTVANRTANDTGCFRCNVGNKTDLSDYPNVLEQFVYSKNKGIDPHALPWNAKVHWQCKVAKDHKWVSTFNRRTGERCPYCLGALASSTNNLTLVPEFKEQFHRKKNGSLNPRKVSKSYSGKIWWQCPVSKDHEWQVSPQNRTSRGNITACPFCSPYGASVAYSNSVAKRYPKVEKLWHPTKNGKLSPSALRPSSLEKVWFNCPKNPAHEWQSVVYSVIHSKRSGCPYCAHKAFAPDHALSVTHPDLSKQWHRRKNGKKTPTNTPYYSKERIWFKCPEEPDHEWSVALCIRTSRGTGCPYCKTRRYSKG